LDSTLLKWALRIIAAAALAALLLVSVLFRSGTVGALNSGNICDLAACVGASGDGPDGGAPAALSFKGGADISFELDRDKELQIAYSVETLRDAEGYSVIINGQWFHERRFDPTRKQDTILFCGQRGGNHIRLLATGPEGQPAEQGSVRFSAFTLEARSTADVFPLSKATYLKRAWSSLKELAAELSDPARLPGWLDNPFGALALLCAFLLALDAASAGKPPGAPSQRLLRAGQAVCAGLFVLLAGIVAVKSVAGMCHTFALPMERNLVESRELYKGVLFPDFKAMYTPADAYNYVITIYPPVYFALVKASTLLLGETLTASRAVSVLAYAALLASLAVLTLRATGSRLLAAVTVLLLLGDRTLSQWAPLGRPDSTAWAFLALGLLAFLSGLRRGRNHLLAAAGLCALAVFTKQQTLPVVLGMLCYGVFGDQRRDVLRFFAAPFAAAVLAMALSFQALSGGNFLFNAFEYPVNLSSFPGFNRPQWLLDRLGAYFAENFALTFFFLLLSLAGLFNGWNGLAVTLLLVYVPFYASLMRSWGADTNYSLGVILLVTVGAVAACAWIPGGGRRKALLCLAIASLALAGGIGTRGLTWSGLPAFAALPPAPDTEAFQTFRRRAGNVTSAITGPTLCDSESYFLLPGRKAELFMFDGMEMLCYEKSGQWCWPCSGLIKDIASRRFHLILLRNDMDSIISATVAKHYMPAESCAEHTLYIARPGT